MERCSLGPDRYRLLTPRFLLLSLVFRLHRAAVVQKVALQAWASKTLANVVEADLRERFITAGLTALEDAMAIVGCIPQRRWMRSQ